MFIADLLSRFFVNETDSSEDWSQEEHCLSFNINISAQMKIKFQEATRKDHVLAKIMHYHYNDWPDKEDKFSDSVNLKEN